MFKDYKDYESYLDAADKTCLNCIFANEDVCNNCPVRKSIEYYNRCYDN